MSARMAASRHLRRSQSGIVADMFRIVLSILALLAFAGGCASAARPLQFVGGADLVYPPQAKAAGIEGQVVVRYDVTVAGTVVNAVVEAAEPAGVFEAAALAAVRSWRFKAPVEDGVLVAAPSRVSEVRFQLGDADEYARPPAPRP